MNYVLHRKRIRFYSQFVKKGQLCFDIGANVGDRADAFLKLGARVIAVEPQTECIGILQRKYKDNSRLVIVPAAVDEKQGVQLLHICTEDKMSSLSSQWIRAVTTSGRFSHFKWTRSQQVNVVTLDSLVDKYGTPSLCKIDVEGYELNVIRGLSTQIPVISFEFTPELLEVAITVVEYLKGLGRYKFNYSLEESMRLALDEWVLSDEIIHVLASFTLESKTGDVFAKLV